MTTVKKMSFYEICFRGVYFFSNFEHRKLMLIWKLILMR